MFTVPVEVLFDIEHELSEPSFMGVPIGSTLGNILHIQLLMGNGRWDLKSVWKDRARFWFHYWRQWNRRSQPLIGAYDKKGRILATLSTNRPHLRDLMVPVIARLGPNDCIALLRDNSISSDLPESYAYVAADALPYEQSIWRREFRRCFPDWRVKLRTLFRKHRLPYDILPRLYDGMVTQSQRIMAYHRLLDVLAPRGIITTYDRSTLFSGLILAAKSRNIRTMTMMHGVIDSPYGYVPLLADLAFCWGQLSFDQMVGMGTHPSRLKITGCQRASPDLLVNRDNSRAKFDLLDKRPLILLASNPIVREYRHQFVRHFCQAFAEQEKLIAAIRLHPSERLEFYRQEMRDFPAIRFTEASLMTQDEALAAADIVVNRSSGFGNDALLKGKPVVIFDVIDAPLGNALQLIERAGCPRVTCGEELRNTVERIVSDHQYREDLRSKGQAFVKYQYAAFGNDAVENIVNVVCEHACS